MREAGILLHISSLPNKYGIGSLGKEAYKFVDFLHDTNQHIWQILPIGPTSYGDSPYQSPSAFACNPYFIDLDMLVEDGLLKPDDLPECYNFKKVDYAYLWNTRYEILHKAYLNRAAYEAEFQVYCIEEAEWLDNYARFMVLKAYHENKSWQQWWDDFKYKVWHAMDWFNANYQDQMNEQKFYQYLFNKQWKLLKAYANKRGVKIMGDIPIYCALDSADVWANPENFWLAPDLKPTFVAGCPPDQFSEDGQLWGNPLYSYDKMYQDGYKWWIKRVKHSLKMFDMLRIDHFRGFAGFYAIPASDVNAKNGHWVTGPGYGLFKAIEAECKGANIVAENLGFLTPDVYDLLKKCKYPGMNIFQFELGDGSAKAPINKKYQENNIFYSGTHDNQTLISFYNELNPKYRKLVDKVCGITFFDRPNLKMIEFCMKKETKYCIIPLQDYLGLSDNEGRMNTPSTAVGNWQYRAREMDFSNDLKAYIKKITIESNR